MPLPCSVPGRCPLTLGTQAARGLLHGGWRLCRPNSQADGQLHVRLAAVLLGAQPQTQLADLQQLQEDLQNSRWFSASSDATFAPQLRLYRLRFGQTIQEQVPSGLRR